MKAWAGRPRLTWVLARSAITVLGVVCIVGSGGLAIEIFPPVPCSERPPTSLPASIEPARAVVSVGGTVLLTANPALIPEATYSWRRCRQGVCTDITFANSSAYLVSGANLSDDGTTFEVTIRDCNASGVAQSFVEVIPAPGLVHEDGEFPLAGWEATTIVAEGSPIVQEVSQAPAGGNPGAYRSMAFAAPPSFPPGELRVFHGALASTHDPGTQGRVHAVDFAADCRVPRRENGMLYTPRPGLAQAGRWYELLAAERFCASTQWEAAFARGSFFRGQFQIVAGPPCEAGADCPDFSAEGAPILFGFLVRVYSDQTAATSLALDIDNWKVTVWTK